MNPWPPAEPHDGYRIGLKPGETRFHVMAHGLKGIEDPVGTIFLPEFVPENFHRIQLRGIGRQKLQRDIGRYGQIPGLVGTGLVHHQEDMAIRMSV